VTVEDIKCFQCKKKFLTQNLFEWHPCFLKTRGSCSKCGQAYQKKSALFKHYVLCEGRFETPEAALDPTMRFKMENADFKAPVKVSAAPKAKGPKKKTVPQRKMSTAPDIVKTELNLDAPQDDNFGNDSDSGDVPDMLSLEPQVDLHEKPAVKIKQERVSDPPAVQSSSEAQSTAELIRNIKREKGASPAMKVVAPASQQQKNMLALKIKAERSGSDQPAVQVLNPLAVGAMQKAKKKLFKIPQQLAMKIKMEKKDAGYGDEMEERDEAEPEDEDLMPSAPPSPLPQVNIKEEKIDPAYNEAPKVTVKAEPVDERDEAEPEDEDLMGDEPATAIVNVKKEKMDEGYGDSREPVAKPKQFINPMALMMKEKPLSNGNSENSLVISAVTSINSDSPEASPEVEAPPEPEKSNENPKMVQIPIDCITNNQEMNESEKPPESMDTNDDLDALLKIYEDSPQPDNNDLFQELLNLE
jgi:hypothetical protein